MGTFSQNLNVLAQATIDVLNKKSINGELTDGYKVSEFIKSCDFASIYAKLAKTYLSQLDYEVQYNILSESFMSVFIENWDKNFAKFNGLNPKDNKSKVYPHSYVSMLMARAIINSSLSLSTKAKGVNKNVSISGMDGENYEDAFTRISNSGSITKVHRVDEEYLVVLEEQMITVRGLIQEANDKGLAKRHISRLERSLEKLQAEFDTASGLSGNSHVIDYEDVFGVSDSIEDDSLFEDLMESIKDRLTMIEKAVLAAMMGGMSNKEIQIVLEDTNYKVSEIIDSIKDKVIEFAEDEEWRTGDDSMKELISLSLESKTSKARGFGELGEADIIRSFRSCINHYCDEDTIQFVNNEIFFNPTDLIAL